MNLIESFNDRLRRRSAMAEHLPMLCALAEQCARATEFGVHYGHSTIGLLCGLANSRAAGVRSLDSYDIADYQFTPPELPEDVRWQFHRKDTAQLLTLPETDLLFVDSRPTAAHVRAELQHHRSVTRYIIFHDTVTCGTAGEDGEPGINEAIYEFLAQRRLEWRVRYHTPKSHGLLVIERSQPAPSR